MEDERETITLRRKFKKHSMSLSCCFNGRSFEEFDSSNDKPMRSRSTWPRSKALDLPEIRGKCRNVISRMGRNRRHSADFSYDPLSYALNFDEGAAEDADDYESPVRNFSLRLPSSAPTLGAETMRNAAQPNLSAEMARNSPPQMPKLETVRIVAQPTLRAETTRSVTPQTPRAETVRSVGPTTPRGRGSSVTQLAVSREILVELLFL
ncbi:hypothetical protein F0562_012295 [Nyssa sinensis]|uniref:Uncharacterized protein n=1 Tax=Nyssa sinensis TaxID=561372 RepID=A0A5J4ZW69_9ASTE|nr:hypothetical protein F0562_012295 [Nyssa sinensis]